MRCCVLVPAFQAEASVADVVRALAKELDGMPIFVIDDGSHDRTAACAEEAGAVVLRHERNRGKGAALHTGFVRAAKEAFDAALTVDADGQHPADQARALHDAVADRGALVLGVRDLVRDGAPRKNQLSNRISNYFLSKFSGRSLQDTQCGLRRYPVRETLALSGRASGYAFEAEIILRAVAAGVSVVEVPVRVHYPPEHERVTHFDSVKDPARIVATVVRALFDIHVGAR